MWVYICYYLKCCARQRTVIPAKAEIHYYPTSLDSRYRIKSSTGFAGMTVDPPEKFYKYQDSTGLDLRAN
jgi:hypothetical protein